MTEDDLDRFLQAAEEWLPLRNENLFLKHRHRKRECDSGEGDDDNAKGLKDLGLPLS